MTYVEVVLYFCFNFKATIEFIIICFKLKQLSKLFQQMTELLTENRLEETEKNKKILKVIVMRYFLVMVFNSVISIIITMTTTDQQYLSMHRYFFDDSYTPVSQIALILSFLAGACVNIVNLTTQVCYYSICIHVVTLFNQMHEQLLELNDKEKDPKAIIKKTVEFHIKIMEVIKSVAFEFREMLFFDFVCYITVIGLILFNATATLESLRILIFLPSTFFGTWIFCHGSFLITNQSQKMARNIYANLNWYEMDQSIKRSVLHMMMQFQKAIEIKLVGIQKVDMELFIVVSEDNL